MNKDSKLIFEAYKVGFDIAEDYADRIMGAGVTDPMGLAVYYYQHPNEIPEPLKSDQFLNNFKNIFSILKRKSQYHHVENEELATKEFYHDHIAKNLPRGLTSDADIKNAIRHYVSHHKGDADAILVARDKGLNNRIISSYRKITPAPSEDGENIKHDLSSSHGWYEKTKARYKAMSNEELMEELKDVYHILAGGEVGSYSHDSAKLDVEIIQDELESRGISQKLLNKVWDDIEAKY